MFSKNKTKCILVSRNIKKLEYIKKKLDKNIKGNKVYQCNLMDDMALQKFLKFLKKN